MNCYFDNKPITTKINNNFAVNYCSHCNIIYIKKEFMDSYLRNYVLAKLNIDYKYRDIFYNLTNISENTNKCITEYLCNNKSCRNMCSIFHYSYHTFKFWYCDFSDYYAFEEEQLNNYVKHIKFIIKPLYYITKIKKFLSIK